MSKKVLNSFNNLVQMSCWWYDRGLRLVRHKESNLSYSKDWVNKNEGLTREEIVGKFSSMVDEYDITLLDELFIEIEDNVATWSMITKNQQEALVNSLDLLSGYDGYYDKEMILENFDKDTLIKIVENLVDLIDETREILKIGLNRGA